MSPISPKRRKLDHDSADEVSNHSGSDEEMNADREAFEDDAPTTKTKQNPTKSHQSREVDESAVYAGGLFKSNTFKIQVDYLLEEIRPNYDGKLGKANETLSKLKGLIEAIEPRDALPVAEATKLLQKSHKISVPFPSPKPDKSAAYKLAYAKPSRINVVGSYPMRTMIKPAKSDHVLSIDMVVVMPTSILQEKDYMNYRYFYKRAYYLANIAASLQESLKDTYTLKFKYLNGNDLHPILTVKPKPADSKTPSKYEINIIPAAPAGFFPDAKLLPSKNSVRPKEGAENATLPPTPFYNASLSSDRNFEAYLKLSHLASKQSKSFADAIMLGQTWLRRRNFSGCISQGGFGSFEWAAIMALLMKGGGPKGHSVLSEGYSSYQMFKAMLQFLSANDMSSKPFIYEASDVSLPKSDTPVFFDGFRSQNLLYKMTPWSYGLLREEAKVSLDMLNDDTFDQFESTFVTSASEPMQRYDCVVRVPLATEIPAFSECDHLTQITSFSRRVFSVLREGLMDRVKLINIKTPSLPNWAIKASGPNSEAQIVLYFVFDPANIDRLVDHGPSAEEKKKALKFQKFWGEKAELRRFKDGSILESLVWKSASTYGVFQEIVTYIINRHFTKEISEGLTFVGQSFDKAINASDSTTKQFEALKEAFRTFEKDIRELEGLPLQLRQLSPTGPQLRYTSIDAPSFSAHSPLKDPANVLIQFEGSGRWPDDLVSIQRTKIAFLLKIGNLLEDCDGVVMTRVGLENEDKQFENCAFLDVVYESGAVFRLRIQNDREQTLLERLVKDKFTDSRTRDEAVSALAAYKTTFVQLPLLTQSISTHCTRFPLLSPTIRLLKMWFDNHMLSGHISGELIELLGAHTFLHAYPWRAPSSVMTGFLRTLMFIERWDWRHQALVVDFTGTMTNKDVTSANTRLEAWRKIDPGMNRTVIFAASNHDTSGVGFTEMGPSKVVAARMTALAGSAYKLVKEKGIELDHRLLFASSTAGYDFVIHISPSFAKGSKRKDTSKSKFKNLEVQSEADLEQIGYQPIPLFLAELKKIYTNSIVFFYSEEVGTCIGGLWNPQSVAGRTLKIGIEYATKVVSSEEGEENVQLDKDAILAEISRLGGDMVSKIEVQR
ncbi:hypothetical protein HYFRA_00003081 [Hymenoscyphus fraxineus]|uniref:U3 small nucleolar RNA-associated protein 22 n=1 Tax=Hymenoscyphus fraxineus TaxID=746836 RepID=A0A9N9KN75_9HELO|nr:hypothetical protein HYFRA_00003081 [Hymenoscyphus fraxineus]